ncbi:protein FAR1-RELATED SEQUENCE 5-like [Trifolium pratense]|uniref:protein FAR1-RELATED SEQUENCE 5-like n=1 Tax=Trifolium pratense TaxID=57577 RepID=UPI001E697FFA|nr:protein FAR1-RELATED SEQUENCE 5-like [Trifolium pratense]
MVKFDESLDVDSNEVSSTDSHTSDDENSSYSASSGHDRSDDGDDHGDHHDDGDDDDDDDDDDGNDHDFADEASIGERAVRINSMTADEIRGMDFGSVDEAYEFYYQYGKCKGFSVRKSDDKKKIGPDGSKIITNKLFVCSRQGLRDKRHISRLDRKREHRRLTRTKCTARFRVTYKADKGRFVVSVFEETHNHELTSARFVHLHPVYRKISEADRAQVDGMQSRGIRTCHIMGYMVAQKGGYGGVGFTKKDLYNYFDKKMRDIVKDGDVAASLHYLNAKSATDPMLYAEYAADTSNGRMKSLFWADGTSRSDYFCFGDVVAFDTTYKRNKYNLPLVIFSGCNHHSQTIIFGAALVSDETTETYKWVLNCFLECMENKRPKAVVTDGDGAMREAIKEVFPDSTHRLCAWHLNKNAGENVKNSGFLKGFKKAMFSNFSKDDFEEYWSEMIKENGVEGHPWVIKTYENKLLWATAYLRDKFFGRIRTTSQCEAINAIIKSYVRKKGCIFEFMQNFEQALRGYRNNELVEDFKSKFSEPVLTTQLRLIESNAAKIYTAEIFKEVKEEIMKAGELIVKHKKEIGDTKFYTLTKYCRDAYERTVVYDGDTFQCSCRLFDSRGLPCSHIFHVMKEEHVDHIPSTLVLSRWTKDAKIDYLNMVDVNDPVDSDVIELARFGAYCSVLTSFCKEASKKNGVYGDIMDDLMNLKKKYCSVEDPIGTQKSVVGDPIPVQSKGAPKKKKNDAKALRHCTHCKSTTHNARTCSDKKRKKSCNAESSVQDINSELPVDLGESSVRQNKKKCVEQPKDLCESSVAPKKKKCSELPKDLCESIVQKRNKCSVQLKERGANVSTPTHIDVTSATGQFTPMYGFQHMIPMLHPVMQQMHVPSGQHVPPAQHVTSVPHVPPLYQLYGMNVGANSTSCYGLLQQVMKSADGKQ